MANETDFTLLAVDAAGIQSYIFGSNRLQENVGASFLVKQVTEDWAYAALDALRPGRALDTKHLPNEAPKDWITRQPRIEDDEKVCAEVLYAGGGKFVALFRNSDLAKRFGTALSTIVLAHAPGLQLQVFAKPWPWSDTGLGKAVGEMLKEMGTARGSFPVSAPLAGLGVTRFCASTGLPAVAKDDDDFVSAEVKAKRDATNRANEWLRQTIPIPSKLKHTFEYTNDFDRLGRTRGEQSYIAVVHADGNGIGDVITSISNRGAGSSRDYIAAMRQFSETLKEVSTEAIQQVVNDLINAIVEDEETRRPTLKAPASSRVADLELYGDRDASNYFLPIRPIVFGGDDTTFVCDGRLGLALATRYLTAFATAAQDKQSKLQNKRLTACAGVAIVKTRYPFARAYELSEELTDSAKKRRRKVGDAAKHGALDWHISASGVNETLEELREREYHVTAGWLTNRPVTLGESDERSARRWETIDRLTRTFQTDWSEKRNKAKGLRDALRGGPEAVKQFVTVYEQTKLPPMDGARDGWLDGACYLYDALELMDLYLPVEPAKAAKEGTPT
ncbi:MAG: hypothetical protein NZ518_00180 [Dehalococcoidia bacterium]|nr:hypothetical protein [Dehalococcoidia bacterium]